MTTTYVDWNQKDNSEPTFYSCIRQMVPKGESWSCVKDVYQDYRLGKEEYLITKVPALLPSILHKPYLTVSLSAPVNIVDPK